MNKLAIAAAVAIAAGASFADKVTMLPTTDGDLLAFIEASLRLNDMNGRNFMIEITESYGVQSEAVVARFLRGCRRLGMRTAIDDFGEGYSSVQRLLSSQVDVVKIGAALTFNAMADDASRQFLSTFISACHRLGVKICVEGVADAKILQMADQMDCDLYQGYYFGKPMPAQQFFEKLGLQRAGERP